MKNTQTKINIIRYFLIFASLILATGIVAQQNHFVYLQTENKQPFYVKLDKKIYSSSASGYVIIPKLKDGNYSCDIGFAKNEWPEQKISFTIANKDLGFTLKNLGDRGWGVFNLQTMELIMAGNTIPANPSDAKIISNDPFDNMLSKAVNDPGIKEKKAVAETKKEKGNDPSKSLPVIEVKKIPAITKILYNTNADGTELVYIDLTAGEPDTIRIFIPHDKIITEKEKETRIAGEAPKKEEVKKEIPQPDEPKISKNEVPVKDKKFIDMELPNPNGKPDTVKENEIILPAPVLPDPKTTEQKNKSAIIPNSDCKNFASEDDFLKLRKKMAAAKDEEEMISAAKKMFRSKCFTTNQVKNLTVLFLNDKSRYDFLDAAYPFISDSGNFPSLENQLSEPYYINRFRVMIRH